MAALIGYNRIFNLVRKTVASRAIMTSASRAEKVLEGLKSNPYFDKYSERIAALQKTSPEELLRRVEEAEKRKEEERKARFASPDTRQYSSVLNPKAPPTEGARGGEKKLDDIMKVDLVKDKSAAEISALWEEFHRGKPALCASVTRRQLEQQQTAARLYPTFVLPLPREQGYEFFLSQALDKEVHFTPLLAYQVHKENAPECLTLVYYTELADKDLVLMRGDYDTKVLSGVEAQCLVNQFQLYYGAQDAAKSDLLRKFATEPDSFQHMDLVAQLESVSLVAQ